MFILYSVIYIIHLEGLFDKGRKEKNKGGGGGGVVLWLEINRNGVDGTPHNVKTALLRLSISDFSVLCEGAQTYLPRSAPAHTCRA